MSTGSIFSPEMASPGRGPGGTPDAPQRQFLIRPIREQEDLTDLMEIQYTTWGKEEAVTTHQIIAAMRNGGIVIGAYLHDQMVGFSYGFPGYKNGQVYLCSHMLAVLPEYRNTGLGWRLKLAQREAALEKGYTLITWTYDPLQTPNARLNLGKLRALTRTYVVDYYGRMVDLINEGIPSDRFVVEWHLQSPRVLEALTAVSSEKASDPKDGATDLGEKTDSLGSKRAWPAWLEAPKVNDLDLIRTEKEPDLTLTVPQIIVTIPGDFQRLKEADLHEAIRWREKTREIFLHYFRQGYAATDFYGDRERGFYLLEKPFGKEL